MMHPKSFNNYMHIIYICGIADEKSNLQLLKYL